LRFGGSKPLALFRGRPMVQWVGEALAPRCDELILSIGATDDPSRYRGAVPKARVVRDARSDRGPIEGMRGGFAAARGEFVLVAPADAPLLRPALYDGLLTILGGHEAAVPRHAAMDPVRAVYRRDAAVRVLADERIASPSALVDRLDAVFLEGDALRAVDPALASFIDVNRREGLEEAAHPARLRD
jgi:molybdopterin-guanine dinucleotide biosynthesis protein A